MSDPNEHLLASALDEFRGDTTPRITPHGTQAVYRTVRRRRRIRAGVVAAAVALAVLVPAGALATRRQPTAVGSPAASATAPSSVSSAPTIEPTSSADRPTSAAPPMQNAPTNLDNATFTVPAWPSGTPAECASGRITFTDGQYGDTELKIIKPVVSTDVNADGGKDSLVTIWCRVGQSGPTQLVALTAPTGELRTLGQVFASTEAPQILTVTPGAQGGVDVKVGDMALCCGTPPGMRLTQVRTFRWTDERFRQTGGPATFIADAANAKVTVQKAAVAVTAPADGKQSGTITIQLHNAGPHAATDMTVMLMLSGNITVTGAGSAGRCSQFTPDVGYVAPCTLGTIAPGGTATLTLPISCRNPDGAGSPCDGRYEVRTANQRYGDWAALTVTDAQ